MTQWIENLMGRGVLAAAMLAAMGAYALFLMGIALLPPASFPFADFLEEFRFRCFNYHGSGPFPWTTAVQMILEPVLMMALIAFIWRTACLNLLRYPQRFLVPVSCGLGVAVLALSGLFTIRGGLPDTPMQAEAHRANAAWRTHLPTRDFTLLSHDGSEVTLSALQGKVVLLTAIYSTCRGTCPMILAELSKTIQSLPEDVRQQVRVLALTLDPENDDRSKRAEVMRSFGMPPDTHAFLNGPVPEMLELLEYYQFGRLKQEGVEDIGHANLFILIDQSGTIAYRFALGSPHKEQMGSVIEALVREGE